MNVLLLGAGGNAGNNFVKSLKLADNSIQVTGADLDKFNLASCNSDHKVLLKYNTVGEKINIINSLIRKRNIDFIHAQPDKEVMFLCEHAEALECTVFNHNFAECKMFSDKLYCANMWNKYFDFNFNSHSLQEVVEDPSLWKKLTKENEKVWCRAIKGAGSKGALPVTKLQEAISWAEYWENNKNVRKENFMLSEFLSGEEYAVQTFWINGELFHSQARERLVYFFGNVMPSGQSSTPSVARTRKDGEIYNTAERAVLSLSPKPNGIYCVDLKRNEKNIIPLEINYGRFFTTSDFFSNLGVNTPYEYVMSCFGKKPHKRINTINEEHYWLRGLDREPVLKKSKKDLTFPQ